MCCHDYVAARKFSAAQAVFQKIPADSAQLITRLWQQKVWLALHKELMQLFCYLCTGWGVSSASTYHLRSHRTAGHPHISGMNNINWLLWNSVYTNVPDRKPRRHSMPGFSISITRNQ